MSTQARLVVVLKNGAALTYSGGEVDPAAGYRVRIRRNGIPVDSLDAADVDRWYIEPPSAVC